MFNLDFDISEILWFDEWEKFGGTGEVPVYGVFIWMFQIQLSVDEDSCCKLSWTAKRVVIGDAIEEQLEFADPKVTRIKYPTPTTPINKSSGKRQGLWHRKAFASSFLDYSVVQKSEPVLHVHEIEGER